MNLPTSTHPPSHDSSTLAAVTTPPIPTRTCCNEVVIKLETAIVIPDYSRFYDGPVSNFHPNYISLADGSLVTGAFASDLAHSNKLLFLFGLLAMLFFRNLLVSGSYLQRARGIRSKSLFRMLFISQLLAAGGVVPMILSYFVQAVNCTAAVLFTSAAGIVSLAILMTGIYGVKVYKCLDNSKFVLITLVLFSCSTSAVAILDLAQTRGIRRVSGSCARSGQLLSVSIYLILQFAQALFICLCFLYAVWKSRNSPVARGRMSIRLSMDNLPTQEQDDHNELQSRRRGWWDYVPRTEPTPPSPHPPGFSGITGSIGTFLSTLFSRKSDSLPPARKPSVAGEFPSSQPPRPSLVRTSDIPLEHSENPFLPEARGRLSSAPSSSSHFSRYRPRMELFRNVMRDEVCYTATITVCYVLVAILSIVGINFTSGLPTVGWISLNWAVASILTIHAFERVVRRHDRDHLMESAPYLQSREWAEREKGRARISSQNRAPYRRIRTRMGGELVDQDSPFDETRTLTKSCISWDSKWSPQHSPPAASETSSFMRRPSSQMLCIPSPTAQFPSSGRSPTMSPGYS